MEKNEIKNKIKENQENIEEVDVLLSNVKKEMENNDINIKRSEKVFSKIIEHTKGSDVGKSYIEDSNDIRSINTRIRQNLLDEEQQLREKKRGLQEEQERLAKEEKEDE